MSQTAAQSVTIKASKIPAQAQPSMEEMLALVSPFNAGQFQECIKDCEQFIQKYPKHYFGYKLLGACHEQLNEWIPAAQHMEQALRLQPKDIEGLGNLAKVYKDIGKRKEAIELYERALSLNGRANTLNSLSIALERVVNVERKAHALDADVPAEDPYKDISDDQLRARIAELGRTQ